VQGMGFGGQTPSSFSGNFFSICYGFLRKKSQTPNKFSRPYKKISNPSLEKFLDMPLVRGPRKLRTISWLHF